MPLGEVMASRRRFSCVLQFAMLPALLSDEYLYTDLLQALQVKEQFQQGPLSPTNRR